MNTITVSATTTPDGVFTVLSDPDHVLAAGWTSDPESLLALVHPSLRAPLIGRGSRSSSSSGTAVQALQAVDAYYQGEPALLRTVPVRQRSTPFRELAWAVLHDVELGAPLTYSQYAARIGRPSAVRAAAAACAVNAAALFVPCHRVLRTDGTLGGFRYGLPLKHRLLQREEDFLRETTVPRAHVAARP
ncbi:methylated-DNA--[protein]-cysteine S-methyltransferase [Nesterenkonia flava]|uniref:Methylated-DNA--[protein]-cysteine S-methyltransferase n=1 Tax=Nesterenkonia flava TaxID=469799 RepID=A0ABU1FSV4_9MICC|nr:methylated-DNA--[protein]-cysteine S-methyltransferase [Nesterenkonia flava]MDR5711307.1 methylated-DNA--[protein]-cysteine S-methyltransferase [Nesterenkonia flava]